MDFSDALRALNEGHKVRRSDWHFGNKYVVKRDGYMEGIPINASTSLATGLPEGSLQRFRPYLQMKRQDDTFTNFHVTDVDLFSLDWEIVHEA